MDFGACKSMFIPLLGEVWKSPSAIKPFEEAPIYARDDSKPGLASLNNTAKVGRFASIFPVAHLPRN